MKTTLIIDGVFNLLLGLLLLVFPANIVDFLGMPKSNDLFYINIFGGVLFGIGIALFIEAFRGQRQWVGLGLMGAIAINLCGGLVLACWLSFGTLDISLMGHIILWVVVAGLVGISGIELLIHLKRGKNI